MTAQAAEGLVMSFVKEVVEMKNAIVIKGHTIAHP
jgi:hypothetical protein